jgi:glucosamine 6-phosphate synthetase-like amidotransferase/phosphosugar isomerase protein
MQILAYYLASVCGYDSGMPRYLTKSVAVKWHECLIAMIDF